MELSRNLYFYDLEGNNTKLKTGEHYLKSDTEYIAVLYFQKVCDKFEYS